MAPAFNYEILQPLEDFSHVLPGIPVHKYPCPPKTAHQLRSVVYDIRPDFAVMYSIFCRSSQLGGGPERFRRIMLTDRDKNCKLRSVELSMTGKNVFFFLMY